MDRVDPGGGRGLAGGAECGLSDDETGDHYPGRDRRTKLPQRLLQVWGEAFC